MESEASMILDRFCHAERGEARPIAKMVTSAPDCRRLLLGDFNQSVAPWPGSVDRVRDPRERRTDKTPSVSAQNHDRNLSAAQVLLKNKVLICRYQNTESGFLGCLQQLTIQERAPSLLICCFDNMAEEGIPNAKRRALVK